MAGVYGEINNRTDFEAVLKRAITQGKNLLAKKPGDDTIETIIRELNAVASWTANEGVPTKDQRNSIDIGVRASRELEGERDAYQWTRDLYALDAYIEDWPSDEKATNATDDDFFDDEEDESKD